MAQHRDHFEWKPPPYEYEFERLPIDLIIGDRGIRERLENLDLSAAEKRCPQGIAIAMLMKKAARILV